MQPKIKAIKNHRNSMQGIFVQTLLFRNYLLIILQSTTETNYSAKKLFANNLLRHTNASTTALLSALLFVFVWYLKRRNETDKGVDRKNIKITRIAGTTILIIFRILFLVVLYAITQLVGKKHTHKSNVRCHT